MMQQLVAYQPCTVDALGQLERFLIGSARTFRFTQEHPEHRCTCLQDAFEATGISRLLPDFIQFQIALRIDPSRLLACEQRTAIFAGPGEIRLLRVLGAWQHEPSADPENALSMIPVRAIRRVAAHSGHAFAQGLRAEGFVLPGSTEQRDTRDWSAASIWFREVSASVH